jgi:cytochrome c
MFTSSSKTWRRVRWIASGIAFGLSASALAAPGPYGLGQPATKAAIAGWNIDVSPDGNGLPPGQGTAAQGKPIYQQQCMACHGAQGQGGPMPRLVGGQGTLASAKPVKTVGSYWPYATTLYDYIHRAMPLPAPQSLTPHETYALTAYILHLNGIIGKDQVINAKSLPKIKMPNRNGFISPDPRPDVTNTACQDNCAGENDKR